MRFIFFIFMSIANYCLDGFVLKSLWEWFIVKTFNLPLLTLPIAVGISMLVTYLTVVPDFDKAGEKHKTLESSFDHFMHLAVYMVFVWLFGYIIHLFV